MITRAVREVWRVICGVVGLLVIVGSLSLLVTTCAHAVVSTPAVLAAGSLGKPQPGRTMATCNWGRGFNDRGERPYRGELAAAVDSYQDIPPAVRAALKRRMADLKWDELVHIRPDGRIVGETYVYDQIVDMHFADGLCRRVQWSHWRADDPGERALAYCEQGHCVIVPTACRNVSRTFRVGRVVPALAVLSQLTPPGDAPPSLLDEPPVPVLGPPPLVDVPALRVTSLELPAGSATDTPFEEWPQTAAGPIVLMPAGRFATVVAADPVMPVSELPTLVLLGAGGALLVALARRVGASGRR